MDDTEARSLLQLVGQQDESAFRRLYGALRSPVRQKLWRMLLNEDDVQEAVQDAFLAVWNQSREFNGNSTVKTWVTGIAINKALMLLRKRTGREVTLEWNDAEVAAPSIDGSADPESDCFATQRRLALKQCLDALPRLFREVFSLRMRGLASPEVAELVSVPEETVRTRLHKATRLMRECISGKGFVQAPTT